MLDTQLSYSELWPCTKAHQLLRGDEARTVKPSAMQGLFFPLSARDEREDSSPWEVKGAFLRGSQSCGWTSMMFLSTPLKGHWQVKYSFSLPHDYHSKIVFLTNTQSYEKTIFFFWRKLACIPRSTSTFTRLGFPNTSVQQKFPCKSTALHSFKLFIFMLLGRKNLILTLLGFFVVFIKFFKISQNYTHYKLNLHIFQWKIEIS